MRKYLAIILSLMLLLTACGKNQTGPTWQEQYDLGVRYLSDGNYEEAIIAFTAAIEINPKRAEAYISAADAYLNIGDFDQAEKILQEGYDATGDETIADILEKYRSGNYRASDGREFLRSGYDAAGNLSWYHTLEYNADRSISRINHFDALGACSYSVEYTYDEQGNVLRGTNGFWGDGRLRPTEYVRDSQGELMSASTYNYDGDLEEHVLYEWNAVRDVRVTKHYNSEGVLQESSSTTYDQSKNPILIIWFDAQGKERSRGIYEYDDDDLLQSLTWYSPEGSVSSQDRYYYDENGNKTKTETCDANGNVLHSVYYD